MSAITQPVVFAIGQTGVAKAKGQFLLLGAAIVAVGVATAKLIKDSEIYQQVLRNVTTDMSEFNKHTNAQIDTLVGLQEVVKLQNAGHRLTAKELRAVGVAAVNYNQSIGGGAGGSTKVFKDLVKSIVKGNERALTPLGIQLDETEDKAKAGAEAIAKLTAKFGEMTTKIQTGEEAIFALENNWGTLIDQQTSWVINTEGVLGMLGKLVDATGTYSTLVEETGGRVNDLTTNFYLQQELLAAHIASLWDDGEAVQALGTHMARLVQVMKEAAALQKIITQGRQEAAASDASAARIDQIQKQLKVAAEAGDRAAFNKLLKQLNEETGKTATTDVPVTPAVAPPPVEPPGGKGGGKKRFKGFEFDRPATMGMRQEIVKVQAIQIEQVKELEIVEQSIMDQRITHAVAEQQIMQERFAGLEQLASIDPRLLTLEEKQTLWAEELKAEQVAFEFEQQRADWRTANIQIEIDHAAMYAEAWHAAFQTEHAGAVAANTVRDMLNQTVAISLKQAIVDGKLSGKVIAAAVRDAAIGGAAQSYIIGLLELVKAAAASAIPFGAGAPIAAGHSSAAGFAFAQAAAMTALAAGFHAASGGGGGGSGGGGAGGGGSGGGGGGGPPAGGYPNTTSDGWQGGSDSGGGTTINNIVNGDVYTTQDLAEELRRVFNDNEASGRWPAGLKERQ